MVDGLRPELVAVVAMVDLQTASERIGRTTAAALDKLDGSSLLTPRWPPLSPRPCTRPGQPRER